MLSLIGITRKLSLTIFFILSFQYTYAAGVDSVNKRTIAIDVGHSQNNPGAVSSTGVREYYYNRRVAELLLREIRNFGTFKAFIINNEKSNMNFPKRLSIAKLGKADLLISIHHDSVQPHYLSVWSCKGENHRFCDKFQGYSIFYSKNNKQPSKSLLFAELLGTELKKKGFNATLHHAENIIGENRELIDQEKGIYRYDNLQILSKSNIPSILLECGIIVNREEEKKLRNSSYQNEIVSAIMLSMDNYFKMLDS